MAATKDNLNSREELAMDELSVQESSDDAKSSNYELELPVSVQKNASQPAHKLTTYNSFTSDSCKCVVINCVSLGISTRWHTC